MYKRQFDINVVAQAVDARLTRTGYRITPDPGSTPMPAQPRTTCDASHDTGLADPLGPCILRAGHDGPVHRDTHGATWWAHRTTAPPTRRTVAFTAFLTLACIAGGIVSLARGDWGWTVTAAIGALVLTREANDELAERRDHRRGPRR